MDKEKIKSLTMKGKVLPGGFAFDSLPNNRKEAIKISNFVAREQRNKALRSALVK